MKSINISLLVLLINCAVKAQNKLAYFVSNNAALHVTNNRTSSLIFPDAIKFVDRGSTDILVRQVDGAENIILLKAASKRFAQTNLTVIADDGIVYTFPVIYDSLPRHSTFYIEHDTPPTQIVFNQKTLNPVAISSYSNAIIGNKKILHGINDKKWGMTASLDGVYIKGDVLFLQVTICNKSSIAYDIDLLRFYITDQIKLKRSAQQEQEQQPLKVTGNINIVKAGSRNVLVAALNKFTIPDSKTMVIQIMEKNGGRHLTLKVRNNKVTKATILSDLN